MAEPESGQPGSGQPETTDDGRWIVVDGRRWRATDPSIPERLKTELVSELMAARRAVKDEGDAARHRVRDAKVALGERGDPWWEPTDEGRHERLVAAFRTLLRHRPDGTVCPSEPSRIVGGESWRDISPISRELAWELADEGYVEVRQRGEPVTRGAKGPIRVARGERFDDWRA
jgi:hypothetical protein